jgi:glycosyltransferase involved in cell wall biosynthesis
VTPHHEPVRPGSLVSVCIPAFNARRFILDTLNSVLASYHQELDIVVSDDASSDGTAELATSVRDSRVRVFCNPSRLGPAANWNRALASARGDFVGLLNHDDLCGPFWIASILHALRMYPEAGWAVSAYRIIDTSGHTLSTQFPFPASGVYEGRAAFMTVARLLGLGPGFLARHQVLHDIGPYDESVGASADNDLFLRLASRHPLYYSMCPHNAWRLHDANLTHSWTPMAQAREGARTLAKAFTDPNRPAWVDQCRQPCLELFAGKSQRIAALLEARDEPEQAHQVRDALATLSSLRESPAPREQPER